MLDKSHKVAVIGHKNPDTDSICSAIAYANLKNETSDLCCEPCCTGKMNQESSFVLEYFGVKPPRIVTDISPQIRDVNFREIDGIDGKTSLRKAWLIMRDQSIDTLAIVDEENTLEGIIALKDITIANMDVFDTEILAKSHTSYQNILDTLDGKLVLGDPETIVKGGRIIIGIGNAVLLENTVEKDDIVILTNRSDSQLCAIEKKAALLILCSNTPVSQSIKHIAEDMHVAIMTVPYDSFAAGKLVCQSAPVSYYMTHENIDKFSLLTPLEDATHDMAKIHHRYFPVLDETGKYCGMVSRRNVINLEKHRIILVDHNEETQAVEGYDKAEILEIIDHHRIGSLQTTSPVYFRNQPVGCTATIITQMYDEQGVKLEPKIAGILLSAILSDTLIFRSPTCTPVDIAAAKRLAIIAGVDIDTFAKQMFEAGERIDGKTAEEVFLQDFKIFMYGDKRFGVMQGSYLSRNNLMEAKKLLTPYLVEAAGKQNVEDLYVLLTDVQQEESIVIHYGHHSKTVLTNGFDVLPEEDGSFILPNVVSRKKQFIPKVMDAYQNL